MRLDEIVWQHDRMLMGGLVFRLQHYINDDWELGENCFAFYKIKPLIDQYAKFFSLKPDYHPKHILELGMWDGGSIAFWFEQLKPDKYVGVDLNTRNDSEYFRAYVSTKGLNERIKTFWETDQSDSARLQHIVDTELAGKISLVFDDASHMYASTKRSFETLFPCVEPGGLYIIEDWAWSHWPEFQSKSHRWFMETPLTKLIVELLEATGSWLSGPSPKLIESLSVWQGFVVIERGDLRIPRTEVFKLDNYISRPPATISRPAYLLAGRLIGWLKGFPRIRRIVRWVRGRGH